MLPDQVSNPGPLTYESGALLIAPRGPAFFVMNENLKIFNSELFTGNTSKDKHSTRLLNKGAKFNRFKKVLNLKTFSKFRLN